MTDLYVPFPDLAPWQAAAVALCEYACGYAHGRDKDDPVYIEVTEHRDGPGPKQRAGYSSCGDQAWWLLYRLGLRKPWMNRAANHTYNNGMNVADLTGCPGHVSGPFAADYSPQPGDILEIWSAADTHDAHVCIVLAAAKDGILRTANYGAGGMNPNPRPGCNISDSPYVRLGSDWLVGRQKRKLQRVIPLAAMIPLFSAPPDLTGARVTDDLIRALGATWSQGQHYEAASDPPQS